MPLGWLPVTARTLRWWPLAAAGAAAAGILGAFRLASPTAPAGEVSAVLLATLVAAGLSALADPAHELVRAVPCTPARQLSRRATVLAPPTAAMVLAVAAVGSVLFGAAWSAPGPAALAALGLSGLGAGQAIRRWTGAAGEQALGLPVLAWAVVGLVAHELGVGRAIASSWWEWPPPVAVVAVAVCVVCAPR